MNHKFDKFNWDVYQEYDLSQSAMAVLTVNM
jgi:hypothetical protein